MLYTRAYQEKLYILMKIYSTYDQQNSEHIKIGYVENRLSSDGVYLLHH